jgi:hypothetical protein
MTNNAPRADNRIFFWCFPLLLSFVLAVFLVDPSGARGKTALRFFCGAQSKKEQKDPTPKAEKPNEKKKEMDAPSQNMNALSVQSLFFVNDEAMHEIDLKVLAKLPETLRLLQEQVQSLTTTSTSAVVTPQPAPEVEPRAEVTTEESAPSFTRRARQQQPAVVA